MFILVVNYIIARILSYIKVGSHRTRDLQQTRGCFGVTRKVKETFDWPNLESVSLNATL